LKNLISILFSLYLHNFEFFKFLFTFISRQKSWPTRVFKLRHECCKSLFEVRVKSGKCKIRGFGIVSRGSWLRDWGGRIYAPVGVNDREGTVGVPFVHAPLPTPFHLLPLPLLPACRYLSDISHNINTRLSLRNSLSPPPSLLPILRAPYAWFDPPHPPLVSIHTRPARMCLLFRGKREILVIAIGEATNIASVRLKSLVIE